MHSQEVTCSGAIWIHARWNAGKMGSYDLVRDGPEILFSSTVSDLHVFHLTCCYAFDASNRNHLVTLVAQFHSENAKPASL